MKIISLQCMLLSSISVAISLLFFAFHNKWIEVRLTTDKTIDSFEKLTYTPITKKKITIYYWHENQLKQELIECVTQTPSGNETSNEEKSELCAYSVSKWLALLDEENITRSQCVLQTCSILPNHQELLLSFDRSFLPKSWSIQAKLLLIESLLKTLRQINPSYNCIRFMVQHEPLQDDHLDFSRPWPLTGFIRKKAASGSAFSSSIQALKNLEESTNQPLIILDPAGDARTTGRVINDTFERAETLQFAHWVKRELELLLPNARILLARSTGQVRDTLQTASLANSLKAHFYVSLNMYHVKDSSELPLYIYYALYDPLEEAVPQQHIYARAPEQALKIIPYNHAYKAKDRTLNTKIAQTVYENLFGFSFSEPFLPQMPLGIPLKTVISTTQPACACEIGLKDQKQAYSLAKPLALALKEALAVSIIAI